MFFLMLCCALAASNPTHFVTATSLKVRAEAHPQGAVLGQLASGERVTVLRTGSSWAEIEYRGSVAYVSMDYIHPLSEAGTGNESNQNSYSKGSDFLEMRYYSGG